MAGTMPGRVAEEPRGREGFGYDPIFVPEGEARTVAELGNDWKTEHSHRARAAAALAQALAGLTSGRFASTSRPVRPYASCQFSAAPKTITLAST